MGKDAPMQQPSVFGQLIMDTYTIILLGFRLPSDSPSSTRDAVVATLNSASLKLTSTFPFLAGQVVNEGKDASEGTTGVYRTVPYPPHDGKSVVRAKDCTELCLSYDEMAAAKAPMTMLDGEILSSKKGFMYQYDMSKDEMPVLVIQANFIKGGLLLNFASQHNALDMNGQGQMIRLFAMACRGEAFPDKYVIAGNMDSALVGRYLRDGEVGLQHEEMRVPSSLGTAPAAPPAGEVVAAPWHVWRIRGDKVAELKAKASQADPGADWISSNDAVTALFWQRLIMARQPRFPEVQQTTLVRAVNGRRYMPITAVHPASEGYMGHAVFIIPTTTSVHDLASALLPVLASALRKSIAQRDDFYFRSLATAVRDEKDHTTFSYGAGLKSGLDLLTSSFAGLGLLHCSFGDILGKAEFARRPRLDEAEGLSYLMPKSEKGDIDLVASLRVEDIDALKADPVWSQFVEYIG